MPKTGLYPKKLVYKFGPCTHGWKASETVAANGSNANSTDNASNTSGTGANSKVSVKSTAAIPKSIGNRIKAAKERQELKQQNSNDTSTGAQHFSQFRLDYDNNVKPEPFDSDIEELDDRSDSDRLQIDQYDEVSSDEDNEDLVVDEVE